MKRIRIVIGAGCTSSFTAVLETVNVKAKELGIDQIFTEEDIITPEEAERIRQAENLEIFGSSLSKRIKELVMEMPHKVQEEIESPAKLTKQAKAVKTHNFNRAMSRHHRNKV